MFEKNNSNNYKMEQGMTFFTRFLEHQIDKQRLIDEKDLKLKDNNILAICGDK